MEFEPQRVEITKLTDALLAQAKTITDQQAAHKIIYDVAKMLQASSKQRKYFGDILDRWAEV